MKARNSRLLAAIATAVTLAAGLGWYAASDHTGSSTASAGATWCSQHLQAAGLDPDHHLTLLTGGSDPSRAEIWSAGVNLQLCVTDGHGAGLTEAVDPAPGGPVSLPGQAVVLDTSGAFGDASVTAYASGFTGADVRDVTVTSAGHAAKALIQNGRWIAWWPVANKKQASDGTVTITMTNGTTKSGPLAKIAPLAS
ncbi:hypothetical protein ABH931_007020 [Streptacidiphilus sp. MAP12-33]|uniref:hypothetical protein n=1 Tax=Streptacidiphilus sp. MAP12-33 TaxID=3156266 RepID=UPI0035182356